MAKMFMDPHAIPDLKGAEDWREMYPYHLLFSNKSGEQEQYEDSQFWFIDSVHAPWPLKPFDVFAFDMWRLTLSQAANKIFTIPPSRGVDQRILNGYLYASPISVEDPEEIKKREEIFHARAGFYFSNWEDIFAKWITKMNKIMTELEEIEFVDLPDVEPESTITQTTGFGQSYVLLNNYFKMIDNRYLSWQYHFELNNLAYGGNVTYRQIVQKLFPGITDKAIGASLAGFDSMLFRPTEELQKLAVDAAQLGIAETLLASDRWQQAESTLSLSKEGQQWLGKLETARHPWFELSIGTGWYHTDVAWNDDLDVPFSHIKNYVIALKNGESILRPKDAIDRERERVVQEYRGLIANDDDRQVFDTMHNLARKVIPFSEDHHFYCEHWEHSVFYRKLRQIGQILLNHGVLKDKEDFVYFNSYELPQVLYDVCSAWALGVKPASRYIWPDKIERRKEIFERLSEWNAPPALGPAPEVVTEPIAIAMWGITTDTINNWLNVNEKKLDEVKELKGFAASAGVVEGIAMLCQSADDVLRIQPGEILVAPTTAPTWAPAFHKIKACVTDIGGVNCHAAIVAREFNMPTVVGTGYASQVIKTGDLIRVDGNVGIVTILDKNSSK